MGSNINEKPLPGSGTPRRVMDSLRRIVQTLRLFDRASGKRFGLSGAQMFVLQKLRDGQSVSVNDLAERTHTDQSSVSVVVKKLVERGLVARERSAADGRQRQICITARGKAMLRAAPRAAQERLIEAVRRLSPKMQNTLAIALERIVAEAGGPRKSQMFSFEHRSDSGRIRSSRTPRKRGGAAGHA